MVVRHLHPGVRLVRLQPRLDARRHRPSHRLHRRQHHARRRRRRPGRHVLSDAAKGMKPDPSMMCNGMFAGLVAITRPAPSSIPGRRSSSARSPACLSCTACSSGTRGRRRPGRRDLRPRRQRPVGRALGRPLRQRRLRCWLNGVVRTEQLSSSTVSTGARHLYGDSSQLMAQLLDAAVVACSGSPWPMHG